MLTALHKVLPVLRDLPMQLLRVSHLIMRIDKQKCSSLVKKQTKFFLQLQSIFACNCGKCFIQGSQGKAYCSAHV